MQHVIARARVISKDDIDTSQVAILTMVKVQSIQRRDTAFTYTLVAEEEADLKTGKLSVESPMGKGLLGKCVGETATIEVPAGKLEFEILAIE